MTAGNWLVTVDKETGHNGIRCQRRRGMAAQHRHRKGESETVRDSGPQDRAPSGVKGDWGVDKGAGRACQVVRVGVIAAPMIFVSRVAMVRLRRSACAMMTRSNGSL